MRKRILHIITSLNVGGAERALFTLIDNGLNEKYENIVVSLIDLGHYGPLLSALGVKVYVFPFRKRLAGIQTFFELGVFSRRLEPHVIQGWMYHGNFVALVVNKIWVRKSFLIWNVRITLESRKYWPLFTRFLIFMLKIMSTLPSYIIYNSDRSMCQHIRYGFSRFNGRVIANGFDTDYWKPNRYYYYRLREIFGLSPDSILIGFVGRNHEEKNIANLLVALSGVLDSDKNIYAVLVGRGVSSDAYNLASFANKLPKNKVFYMGERSDIPEIVPAFDLFCLPSKGEGFPNVIGEAMACGVPCVATDVGDVSNIIGDTGLVVPSNDSESLREALLQALSLGPGKRLELGVKARARIENMFSISSAVSNYINIYENSCKELR